MAYPSDLTRTKNWGTEVLTDSDLEGQLDLIINWVMAFANNSTGHDHSGSNRGKAITLAASGSGVTGVLPIANGGTNISTYTQGDILYSSAANTLAKLGAGTSGQFLKTQGAAANPTWATLTLPFGAKVTGLLADTEYTAATDGFVFATVLMDGSGEIADFFKDTVDATTYLCSTPEQVGTRRFSLFIPMNSGDKYQISANGAGSINTLTMAFWPKY